MGICSPIVVYLGESTCPYSLSGGSQPQMFFSKLLIQNFTTQSLQLPSNQKKVLHVKLQYCFAYFFTIQKTIYHHFFKESQYLFFRGDLWWKLLKLLWGGWNGPITGTVFRVRYGWPLLFTTRNPNTGKSVQLHRQQRKHN